MNPWARVSRRRLQGIPFSAMGLLAVLGLATLLVACHHDVTDPTQPLPPTKSGLEFTYPINGQQNVLRKTQIAIAFPKAVQGNVAQGFKLVANPGTDQARDVKVEAEADNNQPDIVRLHLPKPNQDSPLRTPLKPNTSYAVQATTHLVSGNTVFNAGNTLFRFTTRPLDGRPADKPFQVTSHRGDGNDPFPFTQFNTLRLTFNEPVDPSTVTLANASNPNGTFSVTDSSGKYVPGRLVALGRFLSFDPKNELKANETYTVTLASSDDGNKANDVRSVFGGALKAGTSFTVKPVSVGHVAEQNLIIEPTNRNQARLPDNPLNGKKTNLASLSSQLIGSYKLSVLPNPQRGGLIAKLAEPSSDPRYMGTFPAIVPTGQQFDLSGLHLKLGGGVDTPIVANGIKASFIDGVDIYMMGNSLRNVSKPTMVHMRFDLALGTGIKNHNKNDSLANGVFNQTVMNVVASGLAIPQPNGDVKILALGSFPAAVNRTGNAVSDFEMTLTLKASDQTTVRVGPDTRAPYITAVYPSACAYTFNTKAFKKSAANGLTTISESEANCIDVMSQRTIVTNEGVTRNDGEPIPPATYTFPKPRANNLPLQASPSVTFSEPIDPSTLDGNISLSKTDTGNPVDANLHVEGTTVVINPAKPLEANTQYTLTVRNGTTDLAGNHLAGSFPPITFNTRPMVIPRKANGQPKGHISQDLTQRAAVRQDAPFLTALTPGLPCPLKPASADPDSNFRTGGDTAGRCVGDRVTKPGEYKTPPPLGTKSKPANFPGIDEAVVQFDGPVSPKIDYPVFNLPVNKAVSARFSKPVKADTVVYADGCLMKGGGSNVASRGTVAVQVMDGSGHCVGVVNGDLALLTPNASLTQGFTFRPDNGLRTGQRYWIVICGSPDPVNGAGPSGCATHTTIRGQNGLSLNTNPLLGSGTRVIGLACAIKLGIRAYCFDDNRAQGGPDIVMPFEGTPATQDFYTTLMAYPKVDTNSNGFLDNQTSIHNATTPNGFQGTVVGTNSGEDRPLGFPYKPPFNDALGREFIQKANIAWLFTGFGISPGEANKINREAEAAFLGGGLPLIIDQREQGASCASVTGVTFDDGTPVVGGGAPSSCIPVSFLPGSFLTVSSVPLLGTPGGTGRILLRVPYGLTQQDKSTGQPQKGYIVPECRGTNLQGEDYHYSPCFVAELRLTAKGRDSLRVRGRDTLFIPQQDFTIEVYGPVAFEQNGRMIVSTKNASVFEITAYGLIGKVMPLPSITFSGGQALQVVGPALHGGRAFPSR